MNQTSPWLSRVGLLAGLGVGLGVGLTALIAPGTARADDASAADQAREQARTLNTEGADLIKRKDFAGALDRFQRAYAVFPSPKVLLNIGAALRELQRPADAANVYQRYLDDPGSDSARRAEMAKILTELDARVAILELAVDQPGAEVQIAGWSPAWVPPADAPWIPVAQLPRVRVAPGVYKVRARKPGFVEATVSGTANPGGRQPVALALVAAAVEPTPTEPTPPVGPTTAALPDTSTDDDDDQIDADLAAAAPAPSAGLRLGAVVDVAIDGSGKGAAVTPGVSLRIGDRLEVVAKALVGGTVGGFVGGTAYLLTGQLRPHLSAGVPLFFSDGARFGVRGAGGLTYELADRLSLVAELGAEYFVNPEADRLDFVLVPLVGAHARL